MHQFGCDNLQLTLTSASNVVGTKIWSGLTDGANQMTDRLILAYEQTLQSIASALKTSFGSRANWGVAGLREETLVFLLAESMRKLGIDAVYEPCFDDRTRADLSWVESGKVSMLEAKWWWWSVSLGLVLESISNKLSFRTHAGDRFALVFTVDDVLAHESGRTWATPKDVKAWMQHLVESDPVLRARWAFGGCAATKSPYFGTAWHDERHSMRRDGIFAAAIYRMIQPR